MSAYVLSDAQRDRLNEILDEIIPPNGELPGAGEIGLAAAVDAALSQNPGMSFVIEQGLATFAEVLGRHGYQSLSAAPHAQRGDIVKEVESRDAGFMITLMFIVYPAYYQHERVLPCLGLEPRPPHPDGYTMNPHDLSLLDVVRRRGRMFR